MAQLAGCCFLPPLRVGRLDRQEAGDAGYGYLARDVIGLTIRLIQQGRHGLACASLGPVQAADASDGLMHRPDFARDLAPLARLWPLDARLKVVSREFERRVSRPGDVVDKRRLEKFGGSCNTHGVV